jgi:GT2 family glycosyltransferase
MTTTAEPGAPSPRAEPDAVEEPTAAYPPVAVVLVTRNPGPWLEATVTGFVHQDYPDFTLLVVDCGSDVDPTPRVAAAFPGALVRRLGAGCGFAAAANEALSVVEGATFLLLCHDDVVLDPSAMRVLVEEAYRSNAGIVGPKLVSADDPEVLLDVGRAIDRFGAPFTGIEPGELDQEQHDGVRDVFYVTTATMLVRADLFTELSGFDPETFPGSEDLDLCWRARLAGARVLVAPDARVAHREAADDRTSADRPDEVALARTRVRVLFTSYSVPTLLWLVPVGLVVGTIEAVGHLLTGHVRRARAAIGAWLSNLFHIGRWHASRTRAQGLRRIHDRDLRELQVGSVTRLSAYFSHRLRGDERLRSFGSRGRVAVDSMSDGMRTPAALAFAVFLLLVLVGSRGLITNGVPSIGTMVTWPSVGSLFDAFGSAWRYTGLGSAAPQPALQVVMGAMGTALLGGVGLARTLVVVLAMPVGAFGAYRFAHRVMRLRGPALAAGLAYGINPVARNAIAEGRLGPLVLFALLPLLLSQLVGIARLGDGARRAARGRILRFALLLAFTTAWYPLAPLYVLLACVAVVVVSPLTGQAVRSLRALGVALAGTVGAVVLLFPWPLAYLDGVGDEAALGAVFRPVLDLSEVLRFNTGPAGSGPAMWGLLVAAAVPLFLATGSRLAWATRGWALALAGWAVVWVPTRFFPDVSVPAPEAGLAVAALGLALALGIGVSVLVDGIHSFHFGWRQPAAVIGGIAVLLPVLGFVGDTFGGRWGAPERDWAQSTLVFTQTLADRGEFRMLWVGSPDVLPLDPVVLESGTAYSLTRNGPGDSTELLRAPEHAADEVVDESIRLAEDGLTNRLGRLLAPVGVRYVVMPTSQGRDGGAHAPASPALRVGLAAQLDLARLSTDGGLVLYENLAWIPLAAVVTGDGADDVPTGAVEPVESALGTDVASDAEPLDGEVARGIVLWAEAFDGAWEASGRDGALEHVRTFGWANGYPLTRADGEVSLAFTDQWTRWAMLAVASLLWIAVALWWWRTRAPRRRHEPIERERRERRERAARPDPLAVVLDEDAEWWERV